MWRAMICGGGAWQSLIKNLGLIGRLLHGLTQM
nr:MAG TPA: hypothetical protein [Caudoviricetes sp.]